jgi:hypothetical protein
LAGIFQKRKKDGGSFFWGNSGRVGRTYLVIMAPIFKGQPELMAAIPHFNGSTTHLTPHYLAVSHISKKLRTSLTERKRPETLLLLSLPLFLRLLFLVLVFFVCC